MNGADLFLVLGFLAIGLYIVVIGWRYVDALRAIKQYKLTVDELEYQRDEWRGRANALLQDYKLASDALRCERLGRQYETAHGARLAKKYKLVADMLDMLVNPRTVQDNEGNEHYLRLSEAILAAHVDYEGIARAGYSVRCDSVYGGERVYVTTCRLFGLKYCRRGYRLTGDNETPAQG